MERQSINGPGGKKSSDSQYTDQEARNGATVNKRTWRHEMERQSINGPGGKKWSRTVNTRTGRHEMER